MVRCLIKTIAALALFGGVSAAGTFPIDLVPVGDPGNVADPATGYGAVPYSYQIGKYDVTTSQYAAFLNAVATTSDAYGLYNPKIATDLSTYSIMRTSTSGSFQLRREGGRQRAGIRRLLGRRGAVLQLAAKRAADGPEGPGTTETGLCDGRWDIATPL